MVNKVFFAFLLLFVSLACGGEAYRRNPHVEERVWIQVEPYFLPENHPAKTQLDQIFKGNKRVLKNAKTLSAAGFENIQSQKRTHIIVTTHKDLPDYIFKLYTDSQGFKQGFKHHTLYWEKLIKRVQGVRTVRRYIHNNQLKHLFKTPKKWIYPVSMTANPKHHKKKLKHFILIEEKMDVLDEAPNLAQWLDSKILTKSLLNELYTLTTRVGYNDGFSPDNIPFCKDGRLAFIDTERIGKWPVRYSSLTKYLPFELRGYWMLKTAN